MLISVITTVPRYKRTCCANKNHPLYHCDYTIVFSCALSSVITSKTLDHGWLYMQQHLNTVTHVKISQLVASLQTSGQQVVFARLVTSVEQAVNNL